MSSGDGDDTSVRVAVRIRPQNGKEKIDMNQVCTTVEHSDNQIYLGKDKAFTFDYVFDMPTPQHDVFNALAKSLMTGCIDGYNATLLAYGQTGSGKTYTMGTGFDMASSNDCIGIIPRAVSYLFQTIDERRQSAIDLGLPPPEFKVIGQFLELYNEELIDLLEVSNDARARCKSRVRIHEDANGGIYITGVSTRVVTSLEDTIKCLKDGALCRSTASTNMNAQSSRSHAIFTLYIRQQRVIKADEQNFEDGKEVDTVDTGLPEFETLTAKFHFVDLAGSERLKRTGATGDRAKEGISINCGLLALGNVISALGDVSKRGCHVPYRDSKLTRLLQDSLGGNSRTIMIACISPSDCDFMETLNTLKYANRARNIKNKVTLNQDKTSKQIAFLRSRISILEQELLEYKQGRRIINADGTEGVSDLCSENTFLQTENDRLRTRIKTLQQTIESLQARNAQLLADFELSRAGGSGQGDDADEEFVRVVEKYTLQVEELRTKLAEAEAMSNVLSRSPHRPSTAPCTAFNSSAMSSTPNALMGASMTGSMFAMSTSSMSSSMMSSTNIMSQSFCGSIGGTPVPRVAFSANEFPDTFADDDAVPDDSGNLLNAAKMQVAKQQEKLMTRQMQKGGRKRSSNEGEAGGRVGSLSDEEADEMDVDDEADVEDEDDDDDDDEDEKEKENLQESLANLTNDISLKQRLITELENKQRQLHAVRDHYERQLTSLMEKIRETENERDKVLANVSKVENSSEERVRRIREDFEKKLTNLQGELKRLNTAKREHNKMLRAQQRREQELMMLHRDLDEMKRLKVQLLKKVKEEAKRTRQVEMARDREVAQLRKEKRLRETTIRNLELEKKQRDSVLRRKHEEVEMLRKRATYRPAMPRPNSVGGTLDRYSSYAQSNSARSSSATTPVGGPSRVSSASRGYRPAVSSQRSVSGRGGGGGAGTSVTAGNRGTLSSVRTAKVKWDNLERSLTSVVSRRQTVAHFEQDMQNWVQEREKLGRKLDVLNTKLKNTADKQEQKNLTYELGNIRAQLESAQEQISECQSNIIELEESRDEPAMQALFTRCTLSEARYLLERLFEAAVNKGLQAQQQEVESKEIKAALDSKAAEKEQALSMLRIALQQGSSAIPFDMEEILGPSGSAGGNGDSGENDNDPDSLSESEQQNGNSQNTTFLAQDRTSSNPTFESLSELEAKKKQKARRLTQTPQELLGVEYTPEPLPAMDSLDEDPSPETVPDSELMPPPSSIPTSTSQRSSKSRKEPSSAEPSPSVRRKQFNTSASRPTTLPNSANLMTTSLYIPRTSNDSGAEATPPLTPPPMSSSGFQRGGSLRGASNDINVFSRLTGGSSGRGSPGPTRGMVYAQTKSATSRSIFECTHVAEGHTKAVLDLDVTGDYMITGSKDRTAKLWDLNNMCEVAILGAHHNNVTRVRYCPSQHLLFTVCSYYIKLWDDRATDKCIRTLLSSGLSQEGPPEVSLTLRQNICPPGETNIMDLVVGETGEEMFLATANSVKLWDLRRFCAVGKLHGNHQAPVMVLALDRCANGANRVVTGSKDHYIKVFSVSPGACGLLTPTADLQPPHYDGIESLALRGNMLFSGSRDTNIKKWDLGNPHQENVINNAHRDWIQGMCMLPTDVNLSAEYLLSGCRAGILKLWRCDDCTCMGDVQAHTSAINAVRTNGRLVFTASNDCIVKFWRYDL